MQIARVLKWSAFISIAATLLGSPAEANVGLPMLMVAWPAMWVLLIPIVMLEALVAVQILHVGLLEAAQIAGTANLISTLIGIPITWLLLVAVQMFVVKGGRGSFGLETLRSRILSVTVQSPWLSPYPKSELSWMIPAAELCLCLPFFLMSVWTEYLSVVWFTQGKLQQKDLLSWSWLANELSYGIIVSIVTVLLLLSIWRHERARKDASAAKEFPPLRIVEDEERGGE